MRLRLYHHGDGARVAYRETGVGPTLALVHSALLSHREFEPAVAQLSDRFRVVLPDLPLHGDSEHDPRYPYTLDWFAEVLSGFAADVLGPRPLIGGHGAGAEIVLRAIESGGVRPNKLVLMPNRMHLPPGSAGPHGVWRMGAIAGAVPGLDRLVGYGARAAYSPKWGAKGLSVRENPATNDLLRHAFADAPGDVALARAWAKCARRWPRGANTELLELYPELKMPVLLLWADQDRLYPLPSAEATLGLLPDGQLRILQSAGFLMTYDDPVGFARELSAFCG